MEKFILWAPGGINAKPNEEQKEWLKQHPNFEIKFTAFYRCGFLNYQESKIYEKCLEEYNKKNQHQTQK